MPPTTYDIAASLIKVFEGLRLKAYWDANGHLWTIGYGHTKTATSGMLISKATAEKLLLEDCKPLLALVKDRPVLEGAVLVSFGYNAGIGALKKLLEGTISLRTYGRTSGGVELPGLVNRRNLEMMLIDVSRSQRPLNG